MNNGNGYWTRWLVATMWAVVWGTILFIGNNVIANDKASRDRDDVVEDKFAICVKEQADKLAICVKEQAEVNSQILMQLAKIDNKVDKVQVDLEWVKKAVK